MVSEVVGAAAGLAVFVVAFVRQESGSIAAAAATATRRAYVRA